MSLPLRPARPMQVPTSGTGSVFSRIENRPPASPQFAGKRIDTSQATVSRERRLRGRLIQDGERSYHAYSADELIEIDSLAHHGRPGMPY